MADLNMANRQCCDLDIRRYATNEPWMFADFCNTTTAGFKGDSVYGKIKGEKTIAFNNPIEGTMSVEFQCHPFKIYAMLSDGAIETTAIIPVKKVVTCAVEGTVDIVGEAAVDGTVFVYAENDFGGKFIEGTATVTTTTGSEKTSFTATTVTDIAKDSNYLVCYLIQKATGVKSIKFNDKKIPKDYRITMETLDKDEDGELIPMKITAYKTTVQRNLDLSFSSTGDPASIKLTFDVLRDKNGDVMDIVEEIE